MELEVTKLQAGCQGNCS